MDELGRYESWESVVPINAAWTESLDSCYLFMYFCSWSQLHNITANSTAYDIQ